MGEQTMAGTVSEAISVSPEEYERAGGDPMKIPRLREAMGLAEREADEAYDGVIEEARQVRDEDLSEEFKLCGRTVRPLSAGVIGILQRIKHPMFCAGDGAPEPTLLDVAVLLFCLVHESAAELVRWSSDGTLRERAEAWAFELTAEQLGEAERHCQRWIDAAAREMALSGAAAEKKTASRTG